MVGCFQHYFMDQLVGALKTMILRMISSLGDWLKRFQKRIYIFPEDILYYFDNKDYVICPSSRSLHTAKLKRYALILLVEEIVKQPSIDSMTYLLVLTLIFIVK